MEDKDKKGNQKCVCCKQLFIPDPRSRWRQRPETHSLRSDRIRTIVLKLARGHAAYELSVPQLEAPGRVGIGPFSPQLRDKNAHFPEVINLNLLNQTIPILTGLVSVLVSADEQVHFLRPVNFRRFKCHWLARFGTVLCLSAGDLRRHWPSTSEMSR